SPYTSAMFNLIKDGNEGVVKVIGTNSNYSHIRFLRVNGRYINDSDIISKANVCVISDDVRKKFMYKHLNPIGENLRIKGINFTVVGYLAPPESNTRIGLDEGSDIFIPFSTFEKVFGTNRIDMVFFS